MIVIGVRKRERAPNRIRIKALVMNALAFSLAQNHVMLTVTWNMLSMFHANVIGLKTGKVQKA